MASGHSKSYLQKWLKRLRKQLSSSGKISEIAIVLAEGDIEEQEIWRSQLERILSYELEPDLDLVTKIDSFFASSSSIQRSDFKHPDLFD